MLSKYLQKANYVQIDLEFASRLTVNQVSSMCYISEACRN